jgi:hypothetical protein
MNDTTIYNQHWVAESVSVLKDSGAQVFIASTGAGAGVNNLIWLQPGISGEYIGYYFPYHPRLTDKFVGRSLEREKISYCGPEAALVLAHASYFTAQEVASLSNKLDRLIIGVGLTAAATTDRTLKGGTRVFAAVRTNKEIRTFHATMEQGRLGREGDGQVCDLIALNMALLGAGHASVPFASSDLGLSSTGLVGMEMFTTHVSTDVKIDPFKNVYIGLDGKTVPLAGIDFSKLVVFPGSFRSFHFGHDAVANTVMKMTGRKVVFEITADNIYKSATVCDIALRADQFVGRWPVILRTGASRFVDKAEFYPGAQFVCGYDVAEKVLESKYYPENGGLLAALQRLREKGTVFYVMDRADDSGVVKSRNDLAIPAGFEAMFVRLSDHWDISSSAIDKSRKA